jgi:hypothetical protein
MLSLAEDQSWYKVFNQEAQATYNTEPNGLQNIPENHSGTRSSILSRVSKLILRRAHVSDLKDEETPPTTAGDIPLAPYNNGQNDHTPRNSEFGLTYLEWNRGKNSMYPTSDCL